MACEFEVRADLVLVEENTTYSDMLSLVLGFLRNLTGNSSYVPVHEWKKIQLYKSGLVV